MNRYIIFISFLIISVPLTSRAQGSLIDSLWSALEKTKSLKEKVDILNFLGEEYSDLDLNQSLTISQRALKLAENTDYTEGIFYSCNNLGTAYDGLGKGDSSFFYFDKALALAMDLEDEFALSVIKNNFGLYYLFRGNYPLALKFFQESLEYLDNQSIYVDPVVTYNNIGVIHEEQGNIEKAITYYQMAGEVSMKNGDAPYAYLSFGYIDQLKRDFSKAISYYQDALKIYRAKNDELHIGETLFYIGECHFGNKDYEKAREVLSKSWEIYNKQAKVSDEVEIFLTMAEIYEEEGNDQAALELYQKAAKYAEQSELNTLLVPIFKALARQYAQKEDYGTAYQYQLKYQDLNDTIFSNVTKERIAQLETSYDLAVNKAEREKLQAEQFNRDIAVKQRTILAIASMVVTILVAILAGVFYRANHQKKILNRNLETKVRERTAELELVNKKLLESNEELERFTYIASHDLKEPLRNISSFINLIQRRIGERSEVELKEYMEYVTRNARQMYQLIEDVLNFSRIAAQELGELDWVDLNVLMIDVEANLSNFIKQKGAQLDIGALPRVKAHKTHIYMLFKNLIENGLKYNESEQPCVKIAYQEKPKKFRFSIRDNGIGIDPQYHDQIFEMFRRMNTRDKYEGSGIGLATCKKIVNKYGGTIEVESWAGAGCTFYFTWPK